MFVGRRRSLSRASWLREAISGAFVGALVGWLFGFFDWFDPLLAAAWLAFQGLWCGALVGALIGPGMPTGR